MNYKKLDNYSFYKRQGGCFKWISDYWENFKYCILKCNDIINL